MHIVQNLCEKNAAVAVAGKRHMKSFLDTKQPRLKVGLPEEWVRSHLTQETRGQIHLNGSTSHNATLVVNCCRWLTL